MPPPMLRDETMLLVALLSELRANNAALDRLEVKIDLLLARLDMADAVELLCEDASRRLTH